MKKVLYIASTAAHLRQFHLPYLRALAQEGCAVTAAGAGTGDGLPEGAAFWPVPFQKSCSPLRNLPALRALVSGLRHERFDLILLHTTLAAFYTRLALMLAGRGRARVVNTVHGYLFDGATPLLKRSLLLGAEKLCAGVTDDILVMNAEDLRIARRYRLCRGEAARIPGMGVDFAPFDMPTAEERRAARQRFALPGEAFALVCAAEFSARKNQRFLIRALLKLPERVFLLLPGEGEQRAECMALAERLGVADRVRFPGRLEKPAEAYRAADLCVSSSRSEGLPFAVMEAMHTGLPAVLSRVKGHVDLLPGEVAGRLYPFGDGAAFCALVRELLEDPALRAEMGRAARAQVEPCALERVFPQILPWYGLDK